MASFKVELDIGNDAMRNAYDVARALRQIARSVEQGIFIGSEQSVRDDNGNTVGSFIARKIGR